MTHASITESATDAELLAAMVDHYASTLHTSKPGQGWLSSHAITDATARHFRLGFADRSFGTCVPRSTCEEGRVIRKRLQVLGVTVASGHERFRGCVTVPVRTEAGELVGLYGTRIYTSLPADAVRELWLEPSVGGLFNPAALASGDLVVASSIPLALSLVSAGIESVVAPGRAEGLSDVEIEAILQATNRLVIVARSKADTALSESFAAQGTSGLVVCARPLSTLAARVADALSSPASYISAPPGRSVCGGVPASSSHAVAGADLAPPSRSAPGGVGAIIEAEESVEPGESECMREASVDGLAVHQVPLQVPPCESDVGGPGDPSEVRIDAGARTWRIRGATRSKGYETLRANVMVTDQATGRFHVDTIDLYSSRQRGGFVASCADELNVPVAVIATEIGQALLATEQAADKAASKLAVEPVPMSEAEREDAMAMLSAPDLVGRITCDISALGIVGEEDNALLIYLALVSRKSERPLSVMVQSSPSAGKSTLTDAVALLVPDEDRVSYSALTGQALYYLGTGDLAHKVLCVAEEEGAAKATYALKLLVSAGKLAIASTGKDAETGKLATTTYEVAGPVSLLMTTTAPMVDEELASRLVAVTVAESVSQTRAIHAIQRSAYSAAGLVTKANREAIIARHQTAQRLLKSLPVVIPGVEELFFADATTRSRRDHDKYLSLIAASAVLHQFQRQVKTITSSDSTISYIEADASDVALADRLAKGAIVRDCSDLPPATAALLGSLWSWARTQPFTRRAAREALGLGDTQVKVHLARLVELEYAVVTYSGRTVSYQLAWESPGLRRDTEPGRGDPIRTGDEAIRSGSGRGEVGQRSGTGRGHEKRQSPQATGQKSASVQATRRNSIYGGEGGDYSYEAALRSGAARPGRRL